MNQDVKVMSLFKNTNTQVYEAFQGIDALIKIAANLSSRQLEAPYQQFGVAYT